jgi:hypothetical protein
LIKNLKSEERKMDRKVLKLLYRSLDFALKKKNQRRLDRALQESEELRRHRAELLAMRQAVGDGAVRSFRPQFVERTMARIHSGRDSVDNRDIFFRVYRAMFLRVALVGLLILVGLISYNITHKDLVPRDAMFYLSDRTVGRILEVPIF